MSQDTFGGEKEGEKMALDTQFKLWKSKRAGTAAAAAVPASGTFSGTMGHCIHTHTHTHTLNTVAPIVIIFLDMAPLFLYYYSVVKEVVFTFLFVLRAHTFAWHIYLCKRAAMICLCVYVLSIVLKQFL